MNGRNHLCLTVQKRKLLGEYRLSDKTDGGAEPPGSDSRQGLREVRRLELQPSPGPERVQLRRCWPCEPRTALLLLCPGTSRGMLLPQEWILSSPLTLLLLGSDLGPRLERLLGSPETVEVCLLPASVARSWLYPDNLRTEIIKILGCWGFSDDKCSHLIGILK